MQLVAQPSFLCFGSQPILKNGNMLLQNNPCIVISSDRIKSNFHKKTITYFNEVIQIFSEQMKASDTFIYEKHFNSIFNSVPSLFPKELDGRNVHSFEDYCMFLTKLIRKFESQNMINQMCF
jgi:hypothetical protein